MLGSSRSILWMAIYNNSILEIIFILGVLLTKVGAKGVPAITAEKTGGFSVSRLPSFDLFSLQCNGSHLPHDARAIQYMSLERRTGRKSDIFASISSGGVRLENRLSGTNIYVNGVYDVDSVQGTHLTVLMNNVLPKKGGDVTYVCSIMYSNKGGKPVLTERKLHISVTDIQNMYHSKQTVTQPPLKAGVTQTGHVTTSKQTHNGDPHLTIPMILMIVMAGLLFILFIVCFLLVFARCKANRRQRLREERQSKRQSTRSEEFQTPMNPDCRPLPAPPIRSYPGIAIPPYKSPYHRIEYGSGVKTYTDDTGYDSDASMLYARQYDDIGKATIDKTALKILKNTS